MRNAALADRSRASRIRWPVLSGRMAEQSDHGNERWLARAPQAAAARLAALHARTCGLSKWFSEEGASGSSCTIEQASSRLILVRTNVTAFATRSNVSVWRMHRSDELGSATTLWASRSVIRNDLLYKESESSPSAQRHHVGLAQITLPLRGSSR